ncbi:response regulator [Bdellovibrionota bacterium FG-1]
MANKLILIVEDDAAIVMVISEILKIEGYSVVAASDGEQGINYLRMAMELPSLVLLDLRMPVKDGYYFRQEQAADPRLAGVPVILMSADGQLDTFQINIESERRIRKPLDIKALLAAVRRFA